MSIPQEQMVGAPPEAAPMDPAADGQMPAPQATPDAAMAAMEQERQAQIAQIEQMAPQPESPYTASLVVKLVDAINKLIEMVDPDMAGIEYTPEGDRIDGPLPPEVFVPFVLVMSFVATMPGMDKYMMDPTELINDAAVRKATAQIGRMQKDKELLEKMKEVPEEGAPEEEVPEGEMPDQDVAEVEGAMPEDMDAEDEELMARM